MVRLNILQIPEEEKSKVEGREPSAGEEKPDLTLEEMDLMFEPQAEEKPARETPEPAEPEPTPAEKPAPTRYRAPELEEEAFEQTFSKNRLFLIVGIVLGVLLIAFSLYLILLPEEEPIPTQVEVTGPEAQPAEETTGPTEEVQRFLAANLAENQLYVGILEKLLASASEEASFSLITIVPGYANFVVIARDRDALARLRMRLKEKLPGMDFQVVSTQDKYIDGQKKIVADFTSQITLQGNRPAQVPGTVLEQAAVPQLIRNLSRKHNLSLRYVRAGLHTSEAVFEKYYFHAELRGASQDVVRFLKEVASSSPSLVLGKLSLYPANLRVMNNEKITARLALILFVPKKLS